MKYRAYQIGKIAVLSLTIILLLTTGTFALSDAYKNNIYAPGLLKPVDSVLKVKVGDPAPDLPCRRLPATKSPSASTGVRKTSSCPSSPLHGLPFAPTSGRVTILLRTSLTTTTPSFWALRWTTSPPLHAWTNQMGQLWFPVLSDFWPHGKIAQTYGVRRSDGMTERALSSSIRRGSSAISMSITSTSAPRWKIWSRNWRN